MSVKFYFQFQAQAKFLGLYVYYFYYGPEFYTQAAKKIMWINLEMSEQEPNERPTWTEMGYQSGS